MRIVTCALYAPALVAALLSGSAFAEIVITVDKSAQRMNVARDGALLHTWPVSTGRRGYATPNGSYTAFRLEKDHFSREWDDAPMPHSIFFTKRGHAIHGYHDTRNLGRPASHGCVRLEPQNAAALFALVKADGVLNTKVVITGTEPVPTETPVARRTPPQTQSHAAQEQAVQQQIAREQAEREQVARETARRQHAERHYRERGYALPREERYPPPVYSAPRGYQQRYAYETAPPPAYYRQPRVYGQPYYYVQPRYAPPAYYYDPPPVYYRRGYGYGWN